MKQFLQNNIVFILDIIKIAILIIIYIWQNIILFLFVSFILILIIIFEIIIVKCKKNRKKYIICTIILFI